MSQIDAETYRLIGVSLAQVNDELLRAIDKHGLHRTPLDLGMPPREKLVVLVEEIGEVARLLTYDNLPKLDDREGVLEWRRKLAGELTQLAAMAVAWRTALR